MTKMDLRPSRIGLLRLAQNPKQRGAAKTAGKTLDEINERMAGDGKYLHPTKGVRKISPKRVRAAIMTADVRAGLVPFNTDLFRQAIQLEADF